MTLLHHLEEIFQLVVQYGILLLECAGVVVLLTTAVKSIIDWLKKSPHVRLNLAEGISLALAFKMGGEVLRTVIVREWEELVTLGAIMLLRAAMTLIIHWEIKEEKEHLSEAAEEARLEALKQGLVLDSAPNPEADKTGILP
ncbi:MAG: DUF1622 domain-containing protein [Oscillibacter sp.]|nr:DUF1622 domain-containing protein [Oscillibacter sp.]